MEAYKNDLQSGIIVILEATQERLLLDISSVSEIKTVEHIEADEKVIDMLITYYEEADEPNLGQLYNLSLLLSRKKRYERAVELLQQIREKVLEENEFFRILYLFYNIGVISRLLGDYQTAFSSYMDYLTLDRYYLSEKSGVSFKDLLTTIDFHAKGKELLDTIEKDSRFIYSTFDTLLMKISYYEKLEKYQYIRDLIPKLNKYLPFENDEKKKLYYYFLLIHIQTNTGESFGQDIAECISILERSLDSDLPLTYQIKIMSRLSLYYIKINALRKHIHIINIMKKFPDIPQVKVPFMNMLAHFYYIRNDFKKAADCYMQVIRLSDSNESRLMALSTRMLYFNMMRLMNRYDYLEDFDEDITFDMFLKFNMRSEYCRTTVNFAVLLGEMGIFKKAGTYFRKVVSVAELNNLERLRCSAAFNCAYYSFIESPNEVSMKNMLLESQRSFNSVSYYHSYMMLLSTATAAYLYDFDDEFKKAMEHIMDFKTKHDYSHDPLHDDVITAIFNDTFNEDVYRDTVQSCEQGLTHALLYKKTGDGIWLDSWARLMSDSAAEVPVKYRTGYSKALLEFSFMNKDAHVL